MLLYSRIAQALDDAPALTRAGRVDIVAGLLRDLPPDALTQAVRLMTGDLWPPWEGVLMGIGPDAISQALQAISSQYVKNLDGSGEVGALAYAALLKRTQMPLSMEPLDTSEVYERLRGISRYSGPDSQARKASLLTGLFVQASPIEGKHIARTAARRMQSGIGPSTMAEAISRALCMDHDSVRRAYSLMPDLGLVAAASARGGLDGLGIEPPRPVRPMLMRSGDPPARKAAYQARCSGIRVQAHWIDGRLSVYTMRLRNITASLRRLQPRLSGLDHDLIIDAWLTGFQAGKPADRLEIVRYINRRHLSRKSSLMPALVASDMIYLDGEDLTGLGYLERRRMLISIFGEPHPDPSGGISVIPERVIEGDGGAEAFLREAFDMGFDGLLCRGLSSPYCPGVYSGTDFIFRGREIIINAVLLGAEYGSGMRSGLLSRFQIAVRNGDDLIPVGWAVSDLSRGEAEALTSEVEGCAEGSEGTMVISPQILLAVKVSGARRDGDGYTLARPRAVEVLFDAPIDEADGTERLEALCRQGS